jgi:hypothetical protein
MGRTQCTLKVTRHARGWKLIFLLLSLLTLGHSDYSGASVLYADPSAIPFDAPVSTEFPGLTFSTVPASGEYSGSTVITQMTQTGPALGPVYGGGTKFDYGGSFSLLPWFTTRAMRVDFTSPVSFISVDFRPSDIDTGVLQVYSAEGTLLGEQVRRQSAPFTLSFNALGTPLAYLLATYADTGDMGRVGYEVAALATVPEPETLGLMLTGLALVGVVARRRKPINA